MSCDGAGKKQKKATGQEEILKTKEEKDLGVVTQDTLNPERQINQSNKSRERERERINKSVSISEVYMYIE